jgi:hypothetical protein
MNAEVPGAEIIDEQTFNTCFAQEGHNHGFAWSQAWTVYG